MSKLNVAIADDNERILRLLGEIVSELVDDSKQIFMVFYFVEWI